MNVKQSIEWVIDRGNRSARRKPGTMPRCLPQIWHDFTRTRTRAVTMTSQRITARQHNLFSYYEDEMGWTCSSQLDVNVLKMLVLRSEGRYEFGNVGIDEHSQHPVIGCWECSSGSGYGLNGPCYETTCSVKCGKYVVHLMTANFWRNLAYIAIILADSSFAKPTEVSASRFQRSR
jgi:hypothetical protein